MSNEYLTAAEFQRSITRLEATITAGFNTAYDKIDTHGERIAVLESASQADKKKSRTKAVSWSTAAAAFFVTFFEVVKAYLKS